MKTTRTMALLLMSIVFGLSAMPSVAGAATVPENYHKFCRKCHGDSGSGDGPAAAVLDKRPGDFSDRAAMKSRAREYLIKIITKGGGAVGKSSQMPAHGKKLAADEIEALATYVSTHFCEGE